MNDIVKIIRVLIEEETRKKKTLNLQNNLQNQLDKVKKKYNELISNEIDENNFNYIEDQINQIETFIKKESLYEEKEEIEKR